MAGPLSGIYRTARALGDTSSLGKTMVRHDAKSIALRMDNRLRGRIAGRITGGLGIAGLVLWAEALSFIRRTIQQAMAKTYYVGTTASYARAWEWGHKRHNFDGTITQVAPRQTFIPAIIIFQARLRGVSAGHFSKSPGLRSGLYQGGRYASDVNAFYRGNIGGRLARRGAGRETARMLWGTLRNPDKNIFEDWANEIQSIIRHNIMMQDLVDTGALYYSWQTGPTKQEVADISRRAAATRIGIVGRHSGKKLTHAEFLRKFGQ